MNQFMEMQCRNMINSLSAFKTGCELAARQDDGVVSREESKALKKINGAADRFEKELKRILSESQ